MHAVSHCLPFYSEEQLSTRHEDLLTSKPSRLEDIPRLGWTFAVSALDHRCHPPAEWLWWLHTLRHEVFITATGYMEDSGSLTMVASQFKVQRAQWRLHS
jgi:hypothetical protein